MTTHLDRLREVVAGGGAIAPVHTAYGTVVDAIEPGRATARVPALPPHRLRGPGAVAVLADLALSAAITSTLPAGLRVSTLTLHTALLGPLPPAGEPLLATAVLVDRASGSAVSRADVRAADGRPVAHLVTRCAVLPQAEEPELFRGDRAADPLAALGPELLAAPSLANSAGVVQGGVLTAVLGDRVAAAAGDPSAVDLDVTFLRAVPADGASMTVDVEPVHAGRRLVVVRAQLSGAAGKPAAVATAAVWKG